ncbi:MAG: HRDC domain-containing protein [Actinomycetota bacterium]|nr:HRDC domain-containing protein [Actinomycetota bacterium]
MVVFGASADLFPHRLADDVEEERRIFHVAITRAGTSVSILGDAAAPSPFLAELAGTAPVAAVRSIPATPEAKVRARTEVPAPGESPTFDALRAWRTEVARRDKVPPYVVMSDAHLKGIAERRPSTAGELAACPGIGPLKLERYGEDILGILEAS